MTDTSGPGVPAPGELARLTSERLEAALVGAAAVEAAAKARFLVLLGEFVVRRGWESWGCLGPVQWLSWRQEADGSVQFHLRLPADTAAALVAAVAEATTPEAGVPIAARRADALAQLVLGPEPATPTVLIMTTAEALAGGPGPCITDHGVAIDPATAAAAACDGPVITGHSPSAGPDSVAGFPRENSERAYAPGRPDNDASGHGEAGGGGTDGVASAGRWRQHRYPTTSTRRALLARDRTCRFPGCHHGGRLDAHHLVHWIHGGPRHQENLVLLCPGHHRLLHRQRLSLRLGPDGAVTAWRDDGSPFHRPLVPDRPAAPSPPCCPVPDWDGRPFDLPFAVACLATPAPPEPVGKISGTRIGVGVV